MARAQQLQQTEAMGGDNASLNHGISPRISTNRSHGREITYRYPWHQPEDPDKSKPWWEITHRYPMASSQRHRQIEAMERVNSSISHGASPKNPNITIPYVANNPRAQSPPTPIFVQNAVQQVNLFTFNVENAKIIHELCIHNF